VPDGLEALVTRCLQKDPARRFAKTDELASELASLAGRSRSGSLVVAVASPPPLPAISAEVVPSPLPRPHSSIYHVQQDDKVKSYDEGKLSDLLRKGKLTGVELVRQDDEDLWQPLFESRIYRRVVPTGGDPREAARLRVLRAVAGHFTGFAITGVVMYSTQGHFPFWMGIWGIVLAMQALKAAPTVWPLLRRSTMDRNLPPAPPPLPAHVPVALPPPVAPSAIAQEAARVRALIEQRKGSDTARLLAEVDGILKHTVDLSAREADLEEQTSDREREGLARAVAEARARLERADLAQDRRLFERQLEVLENRQEAIAKAKRVLERLRVRRELAEHQLKQLRLDLSRGAASGLDIPELSSRIQFIRYEVDAREEVKEIGMGSGLEL
jgi:hypothetical protein